MTKGQTMI